MAYRVKQTAQADEELATILRWLELSGAGEAGVRSVEKLISALGSLGDLPRRCPLAPENQDFPFEVRQLVFGRKPHSYRILFTIEADMVNVLHIRHGRRSYLIEA